MVGDASDDMDVVGIAEDEFTASVQVFFVRRGRVIGRNGFSLEKVEDVTTARLLDRIFETMYDEEPALGIP